jgi:hypothetical protein
MVARRESGRSHYAITSSRQFCEQRLRHFQSAAVWPQLLLQRSISTGLVRNSEAPVRWRGGAARRHRRRLPSSPPDWPRHPILDRGEGLANGAVGGCFEGRPTRCSPRRDRDLRHFRQLQTGPIRLQRMARAFTLASKACEFFREVTVGFKIGMDRDGRAFRSHGTCGWSAQR